MTDTRRVNYILSLVIATQILAMQNCPVHGRPDLMFLTPSSAAGCKEKPEREELCQQCAKHTKSEIVYPMCCDNLEEAADFCFQWLSFGLQAPRTGS